jgi:UPF0716 protein FxsA
MPFVIFFFLISLPVLEVASIVEVSRWVGPVATFLILAASAVFGAFLIRSQGLLAGRRAMDAMRSGVRPEESLIGTGAVMLAGVLFMIPGFVSDVIALILLLPATRLAIWRGLAPALRGRMRVWRRRDDARPSPQRPKRADDPIDVEFTEVPPDHKPAPAQANKDSPWSKG